MGRTMATGRLEARLDASAAKVPVTGQRCSDDDRGRVSCELRAQVRSEVLPGLERLDDPGREPTALIALAEVEGRRLRAALERPDGGLAGVDADERRARSEDLEWVRGHLHDTALQILEFIAGDGFGTGLSADKIAHLAGGAARDLRRWLDGGERQAAELVPELEHVAAQARTLDAPVRLVVGDLARQPSGEQVGALSGAVREAVTNARKHARASEVVVSVGSARDGRTAVTVTDDGVGCDPDRAVLGSGLGVPGMRRRMERIGGTASLESEPGGGTCVTLVTAEARP